MRPVLVWKRSDLVVDLLKRPRGSQKILGVVGGVVDDPAELRVGGRGHKRGRRDGGRQQRSAKAQGARVETNGTGHGRASRSVWGVTLVRSAMRSASQARRFSARRSGRQIGRASCRERVG